MKKIWILVIYLVVISLAIILLIKATDSNNLNYYSHTKAICNETNYCQDYHISCDEKRAIIIAPITGAVVQFPENWKDPRNETEKELC